MQKTVDIEKLGIALEDLEDIKNEVEELKFVAIKDLKKETERISSNLSSVIQDIDYEIGDVYLQIIENN